MKFCYLTEVEQGDKKASLYFYAKGPKEAAERAAEKFVPKWWSLNVKVTRLDDRHAVGSTSASVKSYLVEFNIIATARLSP